MNFKKPKFWDHSGLSFWSIILYPFSLLFLVTSLVVRLLKTQKKFPIPVICVGNIYLGGTGKTPLALEIFKIVKSSGKNPGFIKKLAEMLAKVAAPPSTSFNVLVGVLMVSRAVEPKTVSIIIGACYFV